MPANSFSFSFMVTEFVEVWFRIVCLLDAKKAKKLHEEGCFLVFSASESLLQFSHAVHEFGKGWAGAVDHGASHQLVINLPIFATFFGRNELDAVANIRRIINTLHTGQSGAVMVDGFPQRIVLNSFLHNAISHHHVKVIDVA